MSTFLEKFSKYESVCPPGVRLPEIKIDEKYYKTYSIDLGVSNFVFLKSL